MFIVPDRCSPCPALLNSVACQTKPSRPSFCSTPCRSSFAPTTRCSARRPMSTRSGLPTAATYVFVNMIKKLRQDFAPQYFAAVFDVSGEVFRDERARTMGSLRKWNSKTQSFDEVSYDGYKAKREADARRPAPADSLHSPRARSLAHSHPRGRGLRGRRRDRHPGPRGRRAGSTKSSSSPATRT